ncbi:10254_t:CDS:2, partial [Funneliformis caledonium]
MQNDLNHSYEENERMQNSMNQITLLANQLNGLNNKLVPQITCKRKSHADLNAKQLKEIESLKSTVKSLESIIFSMQKALSLKDSDITSLGIKINELEAELEQATQKVLLKDSDTNQLCSNLSLEIKAKELENELEKVTQNSSFKDGLIFYLRSRVSSAEANSASSSNDYKHDEVVEEISHFSLHYSKCEPDGKGDYDSILVVPVIALGGSNTLVND